MTITVSPRQTRPPVFLPRAPTVPIGVLALAGFASGAGMRLLDPLLPMVADSLHVTVAGTSALVAGFMLSYGLGQVVLGPLGDRLGKLRVVAVAVTLYGLFVAACGGASGMMALVALRAASGLFAGAIIPLIMAHLGDAVPYADRQATLGRFMTGMVMAQMLTGPIAGIVGSHGGWRMAFVVLGVFAVGVGATLTARLGRALWRATADLGRGAVPGPIAYLRLLRRPVGQWLLLSAFLDGLCLFGGAFPYVGAFMIDEFHLSATAAGLIVAGFGVGSFVYTRFARPLVRRFGEGNLLLLGGLGVSAGLIGLALTPGWAVAAALQALMGLTFYMFHGVLQARATEVLPEARGAAVSAFALALFLGQAVGALAFGGLLAAHGYRFGFMTAALAMIAVTIFCRWGLGALARRGRIAR